MEYRASFGTSGPGRGLPPGGGWGDLHRARAMKAGPRWRAFVWARLVLLLFLLSSPSSTAAEGGAGSSEGVVGSVELAVCGAQASCTLVLRATTTVALGEVWAAPRRITVAFEGDALEDDAGLPWAARAPVLVEVAGGVASVRLDLAEGRVASFRTAYEQRVDSPADDEDSARSFCAARIAYLRKPCCFSTSPTATTVHEYSLQHNETAYDVLAAVGATARWAVNVTLLAGGSSFEAQAQGTVALEAATGAGSGAFYEAGRMVVLGSIAGAMAAAPGTLRVAWDAQAGEGMVVPASAVGHGANALGISADAYNASFACGLPPGSVTRVAGGTTGSTS